MTEWPAPNGLENAMMGELCEFVKRCHTEMHKTWNEMNVGIPLAICKPREGESTSAQVRNHEVPVGSLGLAVC